MSKGDFEDLKKLYDATAAWLRDCCRRGDKAGVHHAEERLKARDSELAKFEGEKP